MKLNIKDLQQFMDAEGNLDLDAARKFAEQQNSVAKSDAFSAEQYVPGYKNEPASLDDYPGETVKKTTPTSCLVATKYSNGPDLNQKDSEHVLRNPESILKAIQTKDFSKLLLIEYSSPYKFVEPDCPRKEINFEERLKELLEESKHWHNPIRDTEGYARVLTGQMSYGEYLRTEKGKPILLNQRRRQLVRNFVGFNPNKIADKSVKNHGISGLRDLWEYIEYSTEDLKEKCSSTFEIHKFIWIHNAVHLIAEDPIYTEMAKNLNIPRNEINNLCILLTMIEIFRVSKVGTGSVVYAYVREGELNKFLTPLKKPRQFDNFNNCLNDNLFYWLYTNIPSGLDDLKDYLNQLQNEFDYLDKSAAVTDLINPYFKPMLFTRIRNWVVSNITHLINGSVKYKVIRDYENHTRNVKFGVGKSRECYCSSYWTQYNTIFLTDLLEILNAPESLTYLYKDLVNDNNSYQDKTESAERFFTDLLQLLDERIR